MPEVALSHMRAKIPPQGRGQGTAMDVKSLGHFVYLRCERADVGSDSLMLRRGFLQALSLS